MSDEATLALLEANGIPAELIHGDMATLEQALEDGKGVMLAVDSGEIWYGEATEDDAADHMLVVTGVDEEAGMVYLSDPGNPAGDMLSVPIDVFQDAWADSDNAMIVCDEPAPGFGDDQEATTGPTTRHGRGHPAVRCRGAERPRRCPNGDRRSVGAAAGGAAGGLGVGVGHGLTPPVEAA